MLEDEYYLIHLVLYVKMLRNQEIEHPYNDQRYN